MASKVYVKKKYLLAKIASQCAPCAFCRRTVDNELIYGKLYSIGDVHCHYFCVLLSSCLIQKGKDEDGLFGFLYPDILAEIERSKKHRCSYCNQDGATLGCSISQCRKQFHLPCGRERNAVSMFYGNYKTYCQNHAPKQKVAANIMDNIKERRRRLKKQTEVSNLTEEPSQDMVCVICYESVDGFPSSQTFWPPCCARDAWFHRSCLQRMALSAGMHYLKCPLCNDKDVFYKAVLAQGYYVPDRDAAWELEQNAFAGIYERRVSCDVTVCQCPHGREYDDDHGPWDIKLCVLCGSVAAHTLCANINDIYVCVVCSPAAPQDRTYLEAINSLALPNPHTESRSRRGPIMPSRMSLRRTKPRHGNYMPSSSNADYRDRKLICNEDTFQDKIHQDLKMKATKRRIFDDTPLSPIKMIEQTLHEKLERMQGMDTFRLDSSDVIDGIREKFKKPRPLTVKKRIVNSFIEDVLNNLMKEKPKIKEPIKEWNSPKKCCPIPDGVSQDIQTIDHHIKQENTDEDINTIEIEQNESSNILTKEFLDKNLPVFTKTQPVHLQNNSTLEICKIDQKYDVSFIENTTPNDEDTKIPLKFSPNKDVLQKNIDISIQTFQNHYLNEVTRDADSKSISNNNTSIKEPNERKNRLKNKRCIRKSIRKRKKTTDDKFKVTFDVSDVSDRKKKKRRKARENELSIRSKNIHVDIKWKKEQLKLKITKAKEKKRVLKQCVFQYSSEKQDGVVIKPENEISPMKKKQRKTEKSNDNLVQTSISNFFKVKSPDS